MGQDSAAAVLEGAHCYKQQRSSINNGPSWQAHRRPFKRSQKDSSLVFGGNLQVVTPSPQAEVNSGSIELLSNSQRQLFPSRRSQTITAKSTAEVLQGQPPNFPRKSTNGRNNLFTSGGSVACSNLLKSKAAQPLCRLKNHKRGRRHENGYAPKRHSHRSCMLDTLASVTSSPVAETKKQPARQREKSKRHSIEEASQHTGHTKPARPKPSTRPNHASEVRPIPPELVSVLAPVGLKLTKRLPQTREEVLRKTAALRKKYVSPRETLPRRCKSSHSVLSYREDSDDDFYFDSVIHAGFAMEKGKTSVALPTDVTTADEPSVSPLTASASADISVAQTRENSTNKRVGGGKYDFCCHEKQQTSPPSKPSKDTITNVVPGPPVEDRNITSMDQKTSKRFEAFIGNYEARRSNQYIAKIPFTEDASTNTEAVADPGSAQTLPQRVVPKRGVAQGERGSATGLEKLKTSNMESRQMHHDFSTRTTEGQTNCLQQTKRQADTTNDRLDTVKTDTSYLCNGQNIAASLKVPWERDEGDQVTHGRNDEHIKASAGSSCAGTPRPARCDRPKSTRPAAKAITGTKKSIGPRSRTSKVRFAPSTTTFSLKISVKTSASSSKSGRRKQSNAAPALSQSTVQSIANQITQAYWEQNQGVIGSQGNNNSDTDDEEDDSESDDGSASDGESDVEDREIEEKNKSVAAVRGQITSEKRKRNEKEVVVDQDYDTRSVASEITMDVDLLKGERDFNIQTGHLPMGDEGPSFPMHDDSHSYSDELHQKRQNDVGKHVEEVNLQKESAGFESADASFTAARNQVEKTSSLQQQRGTPVSNFKQPAKSGATPTEIQGGDSVVGPLMGSQKIISQIETNQKRKRRRLSSTDSLAGGDALAFVQSFKPTRKGMSTPIVSVGQVGQHLNNSVEVTRQAHVLMGQQVAIPSRRRQVSGTVSNSDWIKSDGNEETVVTDKSHESKHMSAVMKTERCGECPGCLQTFDCLTCSKCVSSLQRGIRFGQRTGCLRRFCKAMGYQRTIDTLAKTTNAEFNDEKDDYLGSRNLEYADGDARSLYTDTGSLYSTASKLRRSRAAKLWSRRWSKERKERSGAATFFQGDTERIELEGKLGSRKKGKKSKSILHDLELPMPTDGSVASMLEGRKSLKALMMYDEADQDWL